MRNRRLASHFCCRMLVFSRTPRHALPPAERVAVLVARAGLCIKKCLNVGFISSTTGLDPDAAAGGSGRRRRRRRTVGCAVACAGRCSVAAERADACRRRVAPLLAVCARAETPPASAAQRDCRRTAQRRSAPLSATAVAPGSDAVDEWQQRETWTREALERAARGVLRRGWASATKFCQFVRVSETVRGD